MSHILFISHSNGAHGAERVMVRHIEQEIQNGNQVTLLMPSIVPETDLEETVQNLQVEVLKWPYRCAGKSRLRTNLVRCYNLPTVIRLLVWCRSHQVNKIYSNTSITILGAQLTRINHLAHEWHFHEPVDSLYGWDHSLKDMYCSWLAQKNTHTIFISNKQKADWERELGLQIDSSTRYNPILPIHPAPCTAHTGIRIGYLGNFEKRKNIPFLIRVYEHVHQIYPNTELWLCGAINQKQIEEIQHLCDGQREDIHIELATQDVAQFYSKIDIFVLPSLSETMPLVSLEAIGCGKCTIQTSASGLDELLENGVESIFVDPTNDHAWVEAISKCMDTSYRNQIAQNGLNKWKKLCEL